MTIKEVTNLIEEWSPLAYAEDFDNVGLLVGNNNKEVTNILIALDSLEETVDEAIKKNCNLIISFHPIIFKGLKSLTGRNYVERTVLKAIKNDIAIYAIHTALDNNHQGVSAKMAEVLQLNNTKVLIPKTKQIKKLTTFVPKADAEKLRTALFGVGGGSIGNYDLCSFNIEGTGTFRGNQDSNPTKGVKGEIHFEEEIQLGIVFESHLEHKILQTLLKAHPYEEVAYEIIALDNQHQLIGMGMIGELEHGMPINQFLNEVKKRFDLKQIRCSNLCKETIKKVAVLGGSGSFAISNAKKAGADIYITADLKYHDFFQAENQIILADIGHYESEQFTKNLLHDYLTKKIINFAPAFKAGRIILSEHNTNPINYL